MRNLILLVLCCFFLGCGGDGIQKKLAKYSEHNVQKASMLYTMYSGMNGYKGPSSLEELKEFFESNQNAQKRLKSVPGIELSNLDDCFVGRDGEPLEFRWSIRSGPLAPAYPICFETVGVDGVRQVGLSGSKVLDVEDDDEYEELKKGKYRAGERYKPGTKSE